MMLHLLSTRLLLLLLPSFSHTATDPTGCTHEFIQIDSRRDEHFNEGTMMQGMTMIVY